MKRSLQKTGKRLLPLLYFTRRPFTSLRAHSYKTGISHRLGCGSDITALHDGIAYFPALLKAIEEAKSEILLEMYWFAPDKAGHRVKEALLSARRKNGTDIKIIYDSFGSKGSTSLFEELRNEGIMTQEYNPVDYLSLFNMIHSGRAWRRNHRKMIVIDRETTFMGGINIGSEWIPKDFGGEEWRDVMVKIDGPISNVYADIFTRMSSLLHETPHDYHLGTFIRGFRRPPVESKKCLKLSLFNCNTNEKVLEQALERHRLVPILEKSLVPHSGIHKDAKIPVSVAWWTSQRGFRKRLYDSNIFSDPIKRRESAIQILTNDAWNGRRSIRRGYLKAIEASQRSIIICNGYFIPDASLVRGLMKAVKRGVDVKVVVPKKPDVWPYKYFTDSICSMLVKRGVKVFEYNRSVLHTKVATFDDAVAVVGSYNLDPISHRNNLELVSVIHDQGFTSELSETLHQDMETCCDELSKDVPRLNPVFEGIVKMVQNMFFEFFRKGYS